MRRCTRISSVILFGLILLAAAPCLGRVLVVHSYHAEYDWVQGVNKGLQSSFRSNVDHRIFYMDTKRHPDTDWKKTAGINARKLIAEYKPNVIITVDDNAQQYVGSHFADKGDIPVVFCGVNANPKKYGYPSINATGIVERAYPEQVLNMLKMMAPAIRNVAWVSDDSATAQLVLPRVQRMVASKALPLKIVSYTQPKTFEGWQKTIAAFDKNTDVHAFLIPLYHTVKNQLKGPSVLPAKVMAWTIENTTKPIVGFWPFSTDDGALCAIAVDPFEHGKVAALMAKQILAGKKASDISIVTNKDGYVIINLKSAYDLNIDVPFELIQSADKIIE